MSNRLKIHKPLVDQNSDFSGILLATKIYTFIKPSIINLKFIQ